MVVEQLAGGTGRKRNGKMAEGDQNQIPPYKRSAEEDTSAYPETEEISDKYSEEESSKRLKTEMAAEAQHFERLYDTAFEFIQKTMNVSKDELENGLKRIKESFKYHDRNGFSDIDFTKSENLCAYFDRESQLSTELSRSKILLALENCEELQSRFNCKTLNVMCIGGGPGFDIVGLCSALHEKTACRELHLSVVDPVKRWESFLDILRFQLREGDFGRSCEIFRKTNASVKFFGVAAEDTQNIHYYEALKTADVILMNRVLSILDQKDQTSEAIVAGMKSGAMLMVINPPYYKLKNNNLKKIFTSIPDNPSHDQFFQIKKKIKGHFIQNLK